MSGAESRDVFQGHSLAHISAYIKNVEVSQVSWLYSSGKMPKPLKTWKDLC